MSKYNKGTAIVTNYGELYTTDTETAKKLGATKYINGGDLEDKYSHSEKIKVNIVNYDDDYYLIEKDGQEYLIGKNGLSDIKTGTEKPKKFIVSWEVKGCGDPQKRFETLKEANKFARELAKDEDNYGIDIVEYKNRWKITTSTSVRISKVK